MSNVIELPMKEAKTDDLFSFFQERFDAHYEQHEIDVAEYEEILSETKNQMKSKGPGMFDELVKEYGEVISSTVITSFGLGPFFHQGDRDGGNVTTIHNARKEIYAKKEDGYDRKDYNYSKGSAEVRAQNLKENGFFKDGYTGKRTDNPEVDHIVPLKSFHNNGGFMLSSEAKKRFSNDTNNLIITDGSLNSSKSAHDLNEFMNKTVKGQEENNKNRFEMDKRRTNAAANRGNKTNDEHASSRLVKIKYFVEKGGTAAAKEAFSMGKQQAWGMLIYVFSKEMFEELKVHGKKFIQYSKEGRLLSEFTAMLKRVKLKVLSQLKNISIAFKDGLISGFLSSIITTIINSFKTTSKRLVRIIREGFLSIMKALKMILFTPRNMTKKEASREAIKLLISGLIVAGGIVIEELLETKLKTLGVSGTIANLISTTLTGIVSGIAIVTVVYMIDKMISNLPSTKELIEKSNELIKNAIILEADYDIATANIRYDVHENFLTRIRKTEKNVDELVNFFEE